jgi:hypothetical protein
MTVHLFGATSSPSVCDFALKRIAKEYGRQYDKQASETIQKNMYVDDCLVSSESDDKAVELVDNLRSLCKDGGFNLTKWISFSSVVNPLIEKNAIPKPMLLASEKQCS